MRIELPQLNKIIEVEKGTNLFKALKDNGVPIASSCKGDGVCGKCVIRLETGTLPPPQDLEQQLMVKYKLEADQRISCQCEVHRDIQVSTTYW